MTRAECLDGPRPCPYVSCKYHLYLDVNEKGGIKFNFPDLSPDELHPSCVLDLVDELGQLTYEELGRVFNLTRERTRQVFRQILGRLEKEAPLDAWYDPTEHADESFEPIRDPLAPEPDEAVE